MQPATGLGHRTKRLEEADGSKMIITDFELESPFGSRVFMRVFISSKAGKRNRDSGTKGKMWPPIAGFRMVGYM